MKKEEEINKNSKSITKTETEKNPLNIDGCYMVFNATFNNMSAISLKLNIYKTCTYCIGTSNTISV
jgi:hypothetical protein